MNETIENVLKSYRSTVKILIPYTEGNLLSLLHGRCEIVSEEHTTEGTVIEAYVNDETKSRFNNYIIR